MKRVLVDSDVFIDYLRQRKGTLLTLLTLQEQQKIEVCVSVLTVTELFAGNMSEKQETVLSSILEACIIFPIDTVLAMRAGKEKRHLSVTTPFIDYMIAMTAVHYEAFLATRNMKHYEGIPELEFYTEKSSQNLSFRT